MGKRVFLIVLDSFGIGQEPDAAEFGDVGADTIASVLRTDGFDLPNMASLGLFKIDGVRDTVKRLNARVTDCDVKGSYARLQEKSKGKDTTIGHWEIAGVVSDKPLPVFPDGFPAELLEHFCAAVGRGVLCNRPYSGTEVIKDYGQQHMDSGDLIVYTSADSVFQVAAHEEVVPLEELYSICRTARKMLTGKYGVGRVIARPFIGKNGEFKRTSNRHDFSLAPPQKTMLDTLMESGFSTIGVGKIFDIFAGTGISEHVYTSGNAEGIERTIEYLRKDFTGLCFVNLVDFDMLYGHRRDVNGYADALEYFDNKLPEIIENLKEDDLLMITADHGCDPSFTKSTDHTREYVPLLMYSKAKGFKGGRDLGTINGFTYIADSVLGYLND